MAPWVQTFPVNWPLSTSFRVIRKLTLHRIAQANYKDLSLRSELDGWLKQQQSLMIESSGYGRLQQYVNYGHGFYDSAESLYGYDGENLARLLELKDKYDPEGLFDAYQPVRRSTGGGMRDPHRLRQSSAEIAGKDHNQEQIRNYDEL